MVGIRRTATKHPPSEHYLLSCSDLHDWALAYEAPQGEFSTPGKPPGNTMRREDFEDVTVRTAGNTGFIWIHFATFISGKPLSIGIDVLSLHQQDGKWVFSGRRMWSLRVNEIKLTERTYMPPPYNYTGRNSEPGVGLYR
ncbi:hypothetical protein OIDMADRAFT_21921 [Oidiodendron maius Zn]|uniref:Uncharacterized protein n=1 Tax=Oidiodendron maius (strain Zn) TaxID=913774 RepID=A0A0C3HXQ4_OIDMZ|nr:hypothetical protein OIDMADRAFT_21921 [Oidiodendron maius Zn]